MERRTRRFEMGRIGVGVWAWLAFLFLILPVLIVIPLSFSSSQFLTFPPPGFSLQWYQSFWESSLWRDALANSLQVGGLAVLIATPLGTFASFGLVRGTFPGRRILRALLQAPMIVPTIVVAVALYFSFSRLQLVGHVFAVALGHAALAVPLVVINVSAALISFDDTLEQAAASLGADRWRTFRYVTLPLIRPSVLAGALFAFLTSFDELLVALFISGIGAQTLPVKMWASLQQDIDPTIAAISTILVAISCVVIFGAEIVRSLSEWTRRRMS